MLARLNRIVRALRRDCGGNAMILVALGMPALIGGAGLAVDTAQWYMWKRELQYAADQAAIAGAWSRAKSDSGTMYRSRATMEFARNRSIVDFATAPTVALADYAGGEDNSVVVSASATRMLPFSGFLTGAAATIAVRAQASFEEGESYTSCLIAVDEDASGAITIGGNASLTAGCGMAALSRSDTAVVINGNPQIDAGWVLAAGGIDSWLSTHTDDEIHEHLDGLIDPFADLTPPDDPRSRTYSCSNGSTNTTATVAITTQVTTKVYTGRQQNNLTLQSTSAAAASPPVVTTAAPVANGTVAATSTASATTSTQTSTGNGNNRVYTRTDVITTTTTTYSNVAATITSAGAHMLPGTYASFETRCDTTMAAGVYVIDGGRFSVRSQDVVTGSGVMIVLKNGAGIVINGGGTVTLTGMTASQLGALGLGVERANDLAGMLVFEDRASSGNNGNRINGNAATTLNGTIYLPNSNITFSGTAGVTSQCLMIAAATITIQGTANMSTFCPPGVDLDTVVATSVEAVRLVS